MINTCNLFIFWTAYPTQGHRGPGVCPRGLRDTLDRVPTILMLNNILLDCSHFSCRCHHWWGSGSSHGWGPGLLFRRFGAQASATTNPQQFCTCSRPKNIISLCCFFWQIMLCSDVKMEAKGCKLVSGEKKITFPCYPNTVDPGLLHTNTEETKGY